MRTKFSGFLTLLLVFIVQLGFAQEKTITGVVTDPDGLPLPGTAIQVKGSTTGTQTGFDGDYTIKASPGAVLVFSYVGFINQEVAVGSSAVINVTMQINATDLDEVIVVGYGTTTKEAYTGSAVKIDAENIEAKTVSNVSQALRGEVAGVNVVTGSGAPGSDATIRIRGFGSVNGNRAPLYVVDGAPYASDITSINPADIESMTILKDAAATSIYGSRGANGVILITTKQGKKGKGVISVDVRTSINTLFLPTYDVIDSPETYIETAWSALRTKAWVQGQSNPAAWASANLYGDSQIDGIEGIDYHYNIWNVDGSQLIDPTTGKVASGVSRLYTPTKWSDAAFNTAYRTEANVQFSGGADNTRYSTSFGYLDDQGYAINSSYDRYTARLNLEHKPKDWLTIGGNIGFTGAKYQNSSSDEGSSGSSGNIFALTNTTPSIYDLYLRDDNGNLIADPIFGGYQYDYGREYGRRSWNSTNGIADANYDLARTDVITLLGNFNIGVKFTDWLSADVRYSGQYNNSEYSSAANQFYGGWAEAGGYLYKSINKNINQNFMQMLRFNKEMGDHSIEAFVAHESTENTLKLFDASATKAITPLSTDLAQYTTSYGRASSYTEGWTIDSYFAQLNYDYKGKYFLTGSGRRDGSSRFIRDKWGTFGSVGLGWIISKEGFMANTQSFLDYLKLKASYGVIGDQGTNLQYGWQGWSINQTPSGDYSFTVSSTLANRDLTWETSKIGQVGLESILFNNKLEVNLDYYIKNTENLFFNQSLPLSSGYTTMQFNDGQLRNSGFEFDITYHIIQKQDFSLSASVNGEMIKNELTQMPKDYFTGEKKVLDGSYSEGHSIYDWYMREWAGVDPATGTGLWNMYYNDTNDNGIFDSADQAINSLTIYLDQNPDANVEKTTTSTYASATTKYVGKSAIPKVRGGFRLNTSYKNFNLTAQFSYSMGGYVYDNGYAQLMANGNLIGSDNWHTDIKNAWKQPGDVTNVPRLTSGLSTDVQWSSTSTRFLTKADFLSLNNINLGYSFSNDVVEKLQLSKLSLYVSGDNLMMLSKRDGLNPSTLFSSSNSGIYMPMTTFSFGAKVQF